MIEAKKCDHLLFAKRQQERPAKYFLLLNGIFHTSPPNRWLRKRPLWTNTLFSMLLCLFKCFLIYAVDFI